MENLSVRRPAVGCIAWLGLCAWLVNESVIKWTERLSSTAWASLHVAAEDVQLSINDAEIPVVAGRTGW